MCENNCQKFGTRHSVCFGTVFRNGDGINMYCMKRSYSLTIIVPSYERINTGNAYIRSFDAYIYLLYVILMIVMLNCMYIYVVIIFLINKKMVILFSNDVIRGFKIHKFFDKHTNTGTF